MKKRIISFILILSMVSGLFVTFGTNVTANGVNHKSGSDDLCNMLTYAYNAMQYSSPKYYIAHHNINNVYNADSLKENFDDSPTTAIVNSLKDSSGWEKFSTIVLEVLTTIFEFDGELTQQDLYDTLLISMLLEGAVKEANDTDAVNETQSFISDIFSLTITVNDVEMPLFEYLKSNIDPSQIFKLIKETLKLASETNDIFSFSINGDTVTFTGSIFFKFISWLSNKKISVENCAEFSETIDTVLDTLEYGFMIFEEMGELCTILAKSFIIWKYVDESALVLLEKMRTYTNDTFLKTAISKYIRLIEDDSISGFINCVIDNICETTTELNLNALCMLFKSKVLSKSAIYTTATLTFTAFDLAGHLSDKAEMIYVVRCLNTVNQAVILSIQDIEDICVAGYDKETSVPYCDGYVSGMLMAYRLLATELDYATEYLNTWYGTEKFNAYFGNNAAWDQWKTSIAHARNLYETLKPSNFMDKALNRYNGHKDVINKGLTVIYDLNGGEGSIPSQVKPYDGSIFLSDTIPTKQGSTFLGWSVKGVLYQSGEELGLYLKELGTTLRPCWCSDELVITALWEPNGTPDPDPDPKPDPDPTPDPDPDPDPDPTPEFYTLSGIIRNATEGSADYGKAVEGVTVTRKASDGTVIDSAVTDATGTFSFAFTGEKGDYIFVLSKAGFQTFTTAAMTIHQTSPSLGAFVIYEEETEAEIIASGTCGDNLTWTLDDAGTLTISGEGEMKDYSDTDTGYPWNDYINPSWIGQLRFYGIKKAILCEGVTTLASEAFVQRRSRYSFRSGNVLENIQLPETLDRIEDYAFSMCTKLSNITIPKSVSHIAHNAFSIYLINPSDTASLQNIFVDPENKYYCDINGILCEKSSWSEEIKRIIRCPSLNSTTTFEIPYTVAYIENYAFSYCENLKHIAFMENNDKYSCMYSIGTGAFYNCINLQGMYLPQNIVYMYSDCFNGCSSVEKYQISEKNEYFYTDENGILYTKDVSKLIQYPAGNSTLSAFTVPDTVTTIEGGAFSNASYLESITIPDTFTEISFEMFARCTGLRYFTIPASVTSIEYAAFSGCSNLQSITIPETVTSIDDRVFSGCSSLESITIPETITSIGNSVFSGCSSLKTINLPSQLTSIGEWAFADCSALTTITIPETITSIDNSVFSGCSSLKTINLPSQLTSIGEWAFADCTSLTSVYFYGDAPTITKNTFKNTPSSLVLYYIAGKSGWTSPTWTDSNGVTYNTATFTPGDVDPKPTVPGDISGDGVLDYFDVTALYAAYQSGEVNTDVMDVNHDGVVDYYDVSKLYAAFRGTAVLP